MKLHSEELHNLYSSPNIIRLIKSRRISWMEYMAHMGKDRKVYKVLVENLKERDHSEDQCTDGIIMDLGEIGLGVWSGFSWLRTGTNDGLL
jgi:hypothetical protein